VIIAMPKENCPDYQLLKAELDSAEAEWEWSLRHERNVLGAKRKLMNAFTALVAHQITCKTGCRQE